MDHWRYYLRGRVLELFGFKPEAIAAYTAAVQAAPGFLRPTNRIAYLLASQERFTEAGVATLQRARRYHRDGIERHFAQHLTDADVRALTQALEKVSAHARPLRPGRIRN